MPHPNVVALLEFFKWDHLPMHLAAISQPFADLAYQIANNDTLAGPELTVALRKLLESKDCAVRARLSSGVQPSTAEAPRTHPLGTCHKCNVPFASDQIVTFAGDGCAYHEKCAPPRPIKAVGGGKS